MSPLANAMCRVIDYMNEQHATRKQALAEISAREEWTPGQVASIKECFDAQDEFVRTGRWSDIP